MCLFAGDKDSLATSRALKSSRRLIWHSALTRMSLTVKNREKEKDFCVAFVIFFLSQEIGKLG